MKHHHENGFILYEALISLIILSVVLTTMIQTLPHLLTLRSTLTQEQLIFHQIYEIKDQLLYQQKNFPDTLHFSSPVSYRISISEKKVCAHYVLGEDNEKTMCL